MWPFESWVALAVCLTAVGEVDLTTLEARQRAQWHVYLLQHFGADLGYGFIWNRSGPYSQDLLTHCLQIEHFRTMVAESADSWRPPKQLRRVLKRYRRWLGLRPDDMPLDRWLQLASSLLFLCDEDPSRPIDAVFEELERRCPAGFDYWAMRWAWDVLAGMRLIRNSGGSSS